MDPTGVAIIRHLKNSITLNVAPVCGYHIIYYEHYIVLCGSQCALEETVKFVCQGIGMFSDTDHRSSSSPRSSSDSFGLTQRHSHL